MEMRLRSLRTNEQIQYLEPLPIQQYVRSCTSAIQFDLSALYTCSYNIHVHVDWMHVQGRGSQSAPNPDPKNDAAEIRPIKLRFGR